MRLANFILLCCSVLYSLYCTLSLQYCTSVRQIYWVTAIKYSTHTLTFILHPFLKVQLLTKAKRLSTCKLTCWQRRQPSAFLDPGVRQPFFDKATQCLPSGWRVKSGASATLEPPLIHLLVGGGQAGLPGQQLQEHQGARPGLNVLYYCTVLHPFSKVVTVWHYHTVLYCALYVEYSSSVGHSNSVTVTLGKLVWLRPRPRGHDPMERDLLCTPPRRPKNQCCAGCILFSLTFRFIYAHTKSWKLYFSRIELFTKWVRKMVLFEKREL